jgi:hypothetical protein
VGGDFASCRKCRIPVISVGDFVANLENAKLLVISVGGDFAFFGHLWKKFWKKHCNKVKKEKTFVNVNSPQSLLLRNGRVPVKSDLL